MPKRSFSYDQTRTSFLLAICVAHLSNDLILEAILPASYPMLKENFNFNFAQRST